MAQRTALRPAAHAQLSLVRPVTRASLRVLASKQQQHGDAQLSGVKAGPALLAGTTALSILLGSAGAYAAPVQAPTELAQLAAGGGATLTRPSQLKALQSTMTAPPLTDQAAAAQGLDAEETSTIRIFRDNTPSVVNITNLQTVRSGYSLDVQKLPAGVGSGFIWDDKGHVVTNFHVIKGASEVQVTLLDQSSYTATVVGFDPDKDVAVLSLNNLPPGKLNELKPVTVGTSSNLLVGQKVYAIGNPFGLDHTLTAGIISGLGRELNTGLSTVKNVIQTDASINPGNSGGILLDSQGRVIGINTAIADPTGKGASAGVGFAIPIDTVQGLVKQILAYGKVVRPALGVSLAPPGLLRQLGLEGVLLLEVPKGSPADKAGLRGTFRDPNTSDLVLGDIIVGLDGKKVKSYSDIYNALDEKRVGDKITLDIMRGSNVISKVVTLGERVLGQAE